MWKRAIFEKKCTLGVGEKPQRTCIVGAGEGNTCQNFRTKVRSPLKNRQKRADKNVTISTIVFK